MFSCYNVFAKLSLKIKKSKIFKVFFIYHKTCWPCKSVGGSGLSADKNVQVEMDRKTGLSWAVVTRGKSRGKRITA